METIIATPPAFGGPKVGEIYERAAFTDEQLKSLSAHWRIITGTIQDPGPKFGIRVVRFVSRKEAR